MTSPIQSKQQRIFGLDLLRAIAIILVVALHGRTFLRETPIKGFPFVRLIDGVDLFFVLSGFLIGGILIKTMETKPNTVSTLVHFWKRRWFRTLPLYYLILIANVLVVKYGVINESIDQHSWTFWVFLQNFKEPTPGFFWESWSLAVEEWFYIMAPIALFVLHRALDTKRAFVITTLLMCLLPLAYRYHIYDATISYETWDLVYRKTVLSRLDSIGYGLLAAWIHRYYPLRWHHMRHLAFALGIGGLTVSYFYHPPYQSIYKQVVYFALIPVSTMALMPLLSSYVVGPRRWGPVVTHISKISYSMYLINLALVAEVIRDNFLPTDTLQAVATYLGYWCIVIGLSSVLYRYYEQPMTNLRDRM